MRSELRDTLAARAVNRARPVAAAQKQGRAHLPRRTGPIALSAPNARPHQLTGPEFRAL